MWAETSVREDMTERWKMERKRRQEGTHRSNLLFSLFFLVMLRWFLLSLPFLIFLPFGRYINQGRAWITGWCCCRDFDSFLFSLLFPDNQHSPDPSTSWWCNQRPKVRPKTRSLNLRTTSPLEFLLLVMSSGSSSWLLSYGLPFELGSRAVAGTWIRTASHFFFFLL